MASLKSVVLNYPAIDNHVHPLLSASARDSLPLEGVFAETSTHTNTTHTLAFMRGFNQLLELYGLPRDTTWENLKLWRNQQDYDELCNRCFKGTGLQCLLLDDGLPGQVEGYSAHDRFTTSPSKRVERIEVFAEELIASMFKEDADAPVRLLNSKLQAALRQSDAVAFKSIIAYRSGLDVIRADMLDKNHADDILHEWTACGEEFRETGRVHLGASKKNLGSFVVAIATVAAAHLNIPVQFHTGFGDSDLKLPKASPAHLQPFIAAYPNVKIVLLHTAYPFTREAGYLASVYENVYLDISLIFPLVSRAGQKETLSQVFELCPTNKILFATDAHFWPETYYLASLQARQTLFEVLTELVSAHDIDEAQAIQIAKNVLFYNSNKLYQLELQPIE